MKGLGELWCWGRNSSGQLGDPTIIISQDVPARIGSATDWTAIGAGDDHTCGIKGTDELWCWGDNGLGQVGDSTILDKDQPTLIDASTTYAAVTGGFRHTAALTAAGQLRTWGSNEWAQLGTGTLWSATPVQALLP